MSTGRYCDTPGTPYSVGSILLALLLRLLLSDLTNGRRIEVNRGFDAATLVRLLTVLDKV